MPKCLFRYQWVKLPRTHLPVGKGIMGYWAKLASRAAFRRGRTKYCGYTNDVMPGMWSGGVVGLKSILGVKRRTEALEIMNTLSRFGYIRYTLDEKTKKLEYVVTDWVVKCSGGRMHEWSSLRNRRLWISLPSPQHHAAPCGSALYIRRIRCMAGPLVPHGLAGDRQCVFLFGACRSIRETWRRFDIGGLGTTLGLGKDKGVEIFSEEWGCLRSAPSAGLLRLPHFQ